MKKSVLKFSTKQERAAWAKAQVDREFKLGKFASVLCEKKDGSDRRFTIKKSNDLIDSLKGTMDEATKKRRETLKAQGMEIYPEVKNGITQWRPINFDTVKEISFQGQTIELKVEENNGKLHL